MDTEKLNAIELKEKELNQVSGGNGDIEESEIQIEGINDYCPACKSHVTIHDYWRLYADGSLEYLSSMCCACSHGWRRI